MKYILSIALLLCSSVFADGVYCFANNACGSGKMCCAASFGCVCSASNVIKPMCVK